VNKRSKLSQGLLELKADYRDELPDKLADIAEKWSQISTDGWQEELARPLYNACHHLAGTGETFGYSNITRYARILGTELTRVFDDEGVPTQDRIDEISEAIRHLIVNGPVEDEAHPGDDLQSTETGDGEKTTDDHQTTGSEHEQNARRVQPLSTLPIYIVEDDVALADHIVMELALQGYDGRAVYNLADLEQKIRQSGVTPGAIVMDVAFPEATTGGIDIINKFHEDQILKAPVIFISADDSFANRLEIIRAGSDAFFVKPFETTVLIEKLESLVGETNPDPLRILVVDDDQPFTKQICLTLEDAGLHTRAINNPTRVIGEVLEFNPDLVILDMYMPEANGMEVAQILRQHESCGDIPLLFLSAETDPAIRAAALNVGVDDFLMKPVDQKYLVSSVANRAQRARALAAKIYRDSLTQLLVHDEIKRQLAVQVSAARRRKSELSYVILDLDNFKQVNDKHGHLTGDQVIKSLVNLLRRSFRRNDILGRYGGEEFVAIMQDTNIADAAIVLERVRYEFSQTSHKSETTGEQFFVTFSAGISSFPVHQQPEELQSSADKAMYAAKEAGRNKVNLA